MHSCLKRERRVAALKAVLRLTGTHFLAQTTEMLPTPLKVFHAQLRDKDCFPGHRPGSALIGQAGVALIGGICCTKMLLCIKNKPDFSTANKGQFV